MLGHDDAVAESDFGNRDTVLDGGLKIDMIRTDPRCGEGWLRFLGQISHRDEWICLLG